MGTNGVSAAITETARSGMMQDVRHRTNGYLCSSDPLAVKGSARSVSRLLPVLFLALGVTFAGAATPARKPAHAPAPVPADHAGSSLILQPLPSGAPHVIIPALSAMPKLSDFLANAPAGVVREMLRIGNFTERYPDDGAPSTEPTVAYLGYTREYLFAAFVCSDDQPRSIRGHLLPRDSLSEDDSVSVLLDTFHDSRRAFLFKANPLGIEADALYTEQTGSDYSFDTVWDTWGTRTPEGFTVLMRIPFTSLRFENASAGVSRTWGIILQRNISRKDEQVFWPQVKHNVAGELTQEAVAEGFEDIERGKNGQIEPYALAHSLHQLNTVNAENPFFNNKLLQGYEGIDTKYVFHNSLALDVTVNPDFSQIGVNNPAPPNQRFAFYYPELRPFFIENSSYFQTPLNLYYTPNIVMPQYGERLTGKAGAYAVGVLSVDDRGPGLNVPEGDPAYGTRSHYYVGRVNRDIGNQSNLGVIFADQQYMNSFNRNGGVDYRTRIAGRWTLTGQGVTSETQSTGSAWQSGQGWVQGVSYTDLHTSFWMRYSDIASGYLTQTGFFTRPDVRQPNGRYSYTFRPAHGPLLSHGISVYSERIWDHTGLPLDYYLMPSYNFNFKHSTGGSIFAMLGQDRLRPSDYSALPANVEYHSIGAGVDFYTSPTPSVSLGYSGFAGSSINYSPPSGEGPVPVHAGSDQLSFEIKPVKTLNLSNSYEFDRFTQPVTGAVAYDNHQIVERWNLQMDKAWSVNFIGVYLATLPNTTYTSVTNTKDIYGNLLLTFLPHPGTAFYLGFTTDYVNLNSNLCTRESDGTCNPQYPILPTTSSPQMNDQRIFYVKINHLFRF